MKRLGSSFRERNDKNSRTQQRPNLLSGFFEDPPSWLDSSSDADGIEQTIEQTEFYFLLFALDFFLKTPGSQISAGSLQDCRGKLDGTFQNSNPATSGSRFLKRFSRLASKKKRDGQVEEIERKQRTRKRNNKNDNDNQRRVKPLKRLKSSVINNLPRGEGDEKNTHTLTHWE